MLENLKILVLGVDTWGKDDTLEGALKKANNPKDYLAYIVHPDTYVDNEGFINYPSDAKPKEFHKVIKKVRK